MGYKKLDILERECMPLKIREYNSYVIAGSNDVNDRVMSATHENFVNYQWLASGKTTLEYDFKGNVVKQTKQFAEQYNQELNWATTLVLQNEVFTQETTYDALNRPVTLTQPDNTLLYYGYDKGGLLNLIQRNNTEIHISNIEYNEKQQRLNIYYGNNTKTKYEYNPLNFRLIRILTTRNTGQDILQVLNYVYDAEGNIIAQTDNAQQIHYFNNHVISPTGTYIYDALYRLISATGRELSNLTAPSNNDFPDDIPCPNTAENAMQNYNHAYEYDELGNMLSDAWKTNEYAIGNNYLLGHNDLTNQYTYDVHGNMLTMPHLSSMEWDYKDQLHSAGNNSFISYYNYDAQGNRSRKVVEKGNIIETRYYINGYELYKKENNGIIDIERTTLNIADDEKVFVRIETKTGENSVVRYQYDNHLGSSCLELDESGDIISYEEYHPFGTTSYRSGKMETEVSLKRYKYCGKERDEETGLYYYGMRYYAAWLCRFVSVDPLQFKYPHYTPYQYAGNKPISFIDLDVGEPVEKKLTEFFNAVLKSATKQEAELRIYNLRIRMTNSQEPDKEYYFSPIDGINIPYDERKILNTNDVTFEVKSDDSNLSYRGWGHFDKRISSLENTKVSGIEFYAGKLGKGTTGGLMTSGSGFMIRFYNRKLTVLYALLDETSYNNLKKDFEDKVSQEFNRILNLKENSQLKDYYFLGKEYESVIKLYNQTQKNSNKKDSIHKEYEKALNTYEIHRKEYSKKYDDKH